MRSRAGHERRDEDEPVARGIGYGDYRVARERFFERLRVDSEVRRLERAWTLTSRAPRAGETGR